MVDVGMNGGILINLLPNSRFTPTGRWKTPVVPKSVKLLGRFG